MRLRRRDALGGALAVPLLAAAARAADAELKIGALFPFSGTLALLGDETFRGIEIAADEINGGGGIQGNTIRLIRGDAVDNTQAIGEARRLISFVGVKAIFGTYSSARSVAASQVAELAEVPYFEVGATTDSLTERGFHFFFRTNPAADEMGRRAIALVEQAIAPRLGLDPKGLKLALVYEDSAYGSAVSRHERRNAEAKGMVVVAAESYPATTVDMSSIALRVKDRAPDIVMQTSYQNDSVLFLRQLHEAGFVPKAIVGGGGGYSMQPTADAVGHDLMDGIFDIDYTQYAVNQAAAPGNAAFVDVYKRKYGSLPRSGHSLNAYVGAMAVLGSLRQAKSLDSEGIRTAAMAIDIPRGKTAAGYGMKFAANGQNERAEMFAMQWQDGKLVTVWPDEVAVAPMRIAGHGGTQ
jgi:branched-chain amino acid transport system substrate-binding protein